MAQLGRSVLSFRSFPALRWCTVLAAVGSLVGAGPAEAATSSVEIAVKNTTTVSVSIRSGKTGLVAADRVRGDVRVVLSAAADPDTPSVQQTSYAAGKNGCSVPDHPEAGTLNRSIDVTALRGSIATIYLRVTYKADGTLNDVATTLEPFGPQPGTTLPGGTPMSVDLCIG